MKILLAEDDIVSSRVIEATLQKRKFEVTVVRSGIEAINMLKLGEQYDVIISDIKLPVVNGFKLLQFVRTSQRYKNIPVIITTAVNEQKAILTTLKLGISGYLIKPILAERLIQKINEIFKNPHSSVLIVDDEEIIRSLLKNVLEIEGFKVETAIDGVDALQVLYDKKVSIIISDIKMPRMSGTELLSEVKMKFPEIPMILMTGFGLDFTKEEALDFGADDYITKPFKNIEIIEKIKVNILHTEKELVYNL